MRLAIAVGGVRPPFFQSVELHTHLTRQCLQRFAPQQPQYRVPLPASVQPLHPRFPFWNSPSSTGAQNFVQVEEVCAIQTKIPLWVTRQDKYLQPLPCLFQYPYHTGKATREDAPGDDYSSLAIPQHPPAREDRGSPPAARRRGGALPPGATSQP